MFKALLETLYMFIISTVVAYGLALPLAIITNETGEKGLFQNKIINSILNIIIGIGRSIPFVILTILTLPFTRAITGSGIGTTASIVPLTLSAVPYIARNIELSLNKVNYEIVEASQLDGASKLEIIFKIKVGSQLYDIIKNTSITAISLIDYSTMVSIIGGGGLGSYALTNGYYRYDWSVVLYSTLLLLLIILTIQILSKKVSKKIDWR